MNSDARVAEVMRASHGRLLAILASRTGDILAAEDALSDAFARAHSRWPIDMPENPEAWLLNLCGVELSFHTDRGAFSAVFIQDVESSERGGVIIGAEKRVSRLCEAG